MRVAFFGGTFDPIHQGHLSIARAAAEAFSLDRVLFAPVGLQPLKAKHAAAPYSDRLAMIEIALRAASNPCFASSTLDAPRADGAPNYTIDTLAALSLQYPAASLYVLTGADSFLTMRKWRSPDELLACAEWIVVSRPEFPLHEDQLTALSLTDDQRKRIHILGNIHEDVSATDLRRRLANGESCTGLLPEPVAEYIRSHGLYRQHATTSNLN